MTSGPWLRARQRVTMPDMRTRLLVGSASFVAVMAAFEVAHLVLGAPRAVGPVIGLVLSTLIILDPAELISEPTRP